LLMQRYAKRLILATFWAAVIANFGNLLSGRLLSDADRDHDAAPLAGRIIAVGVSGASAISPVGTFLPGGPLHDKPAFAAYTLPGRVLDPARILVASGSNFGAPPANPGEREGSFLSIDPDGAATVEVPTRFAEGGGQASALAGRVQLYTAQS